LEATFLREIMVFGISDVMMVQWIEILDWLGVDFQKFRLELVEIGFVKENSNGVASGEVEVQNSEVVNRNCAKFRSDLAAIHATRTREINQGVRTILNGVIRRRREKAM